MSKLKVKEQTGGICLLEGAGEITAVDFAGGRSILGELLGPEWVSSRIAIDFERINYIDSSAIGWLIASHKELKSHGGMMVIYAVQPQVKQLLEMLKIGRLVPILPNLDAAREALNTAGVQK